MDITNNNIILYSMKRISIVFYCCLLFNCIYYETDEDTFITREETEVVIDTSKTGDRIDSIWKHQIKIIYIIDKIDTISRDTNLISFGITYNKGGSLGNLICRRNRLDYYALLPTCRDKTLGTGTDTIRDLRDSVQSIYGYQNGLLHGLMTWYDSVGFISRTVNYQDGREHGLTILYDSGGSISSLWCYQNGSQTDALLPTCRDKTPGTGTDTIRDLRDSVQLIYDYQDGLLHGLKIWYDSVGSISHTVNYQYGQKHGLKTWYDIDGSIWFLACYQNEVLIKDTTSDFENFTCP